MSDAPPPSYASLVAQNPRRNATIDPAPRDPRIPHPDTFLVPHPVRRTGRQRVHIVTKGTAVGIWREWSIVQSHINRVKGNCHNSFSCWEDALDAYRKEYDRDEIKILPPPPPLPGSSADNPMQVSSRDPSPMPGASSRPILVTSSPARPVQSPAHPAPLPRPAVNILQTGGGQPAAYQGQGPAPTISMSRSGPASRPVYIIEDSPTPSPESHAAPAAHSRLATPTPTPTKGKGKGKATSMAGTSSSGSVHPSGTPQHTASSSSSTVRPIEATTCGASGASSLTSRPTEAGVCGAITSSVYTSSPVPSAPLSHANTDPPSTPPRTLGKHAIKNGPWTPVPSSSPASSQARFSSPPIGRVLFPQPPSAPRAVSSATADPVGHPGSVTVTVSVTYNPGPTPPRPSPFRVREPSAPPMAIDRARSLFPGIDDPDPNHTGAGYDWGDDLTVEDLLHCQDVEDIAYFQSSTPQRYTMLPVTPPRLRRRHY